MDQHLQLLVHAGAPSTRQDDGRYAAQAEAYLNLTPSRHERVQIDPRPTVGTARPSTCIAAQSQQPNVTMESIHDTSDVDATVYVEDTQLAYTALESQLRSSSRSVVKQTPARAVDTNPSRDSTAATTSSKRRSRLSQSSYLVSPQLERSKQARGVQKREQAQQLPRQVRKPHVNVSTGRPEVLRTDGSDKENSGQTAIDDDEVSSELPTSYSLSAGASARSNDRPQSPEKSLSDPGLADAGPAGNNATCASRAIASPSQRRALREDTRDSPITKPSEPRASSKPLRIFADFGDTEQSTSLKFPLHILPPGPKTSVKPFQTHVTPALQHLVQKSAVATSFNPVSQTRELEASERGHWLVQCQDWTFSEQVAFWESLEKSIGSAGWGVWCSRGTDHQLQTAENESDESPAAPASAPQRHAFGPIRVWCWGEVVKHVYLLLYVASKSKVRRLGLHWIDSDGHVIIKMRQAREQVD